MTIPGKKISQFPDGGALEGTDQIVVARAGQNYSILGSAISDRSMDGRLSLEANVPVSTSDQTAKTSVYLNPYIGNKISLYDGTGWETLSFSSISVSVPATTNTPFDIFCYNNAGTPTLVTENWNNDSTRGFALDYQDGVLVRSGTPTRRYVGTGRTTGTSGRCEDSVTKRFIWNYYNRVSRSLQVTGAATHTNTNTAIANWNGDATLRVEWVNGRIEGDFLVSILTDMTCAATSSTGQGCVGIGINTTAALSGIIYWQSAFRARSTGMATGQPLSGHNYIQLLERGLTGVTFYVAQINMTVMV